MKKKYILTYNCNSCGKENLIFELSLREYYARQAFKCVCGGINLNFKSKELIK